MKTSLLVLAFCLAAGMAFQADAKKDATVQEKDTEEKVQLTTFAEYDEMTFEEQNKFIADRGVTIYAWLKENDPAKAKCMFEKFEIAKKSTKPSPAMTVLEGKIKGVPKEDRSKYYVDNLMANYIIDDLCANTVAPVSANQPKPATK